MADFVEFNNDQRREKVNSDQRYAIWREAKRKAAGYRGSLVWHTSNDTEYLVRSYYDATGVRRQRVVGRRSPETEGEKEAWEQGRLSAERKLDELQNLHARQVAVNRALRLGRVPLLAARIIRALDSVGLLGSGIRIAGTNAIYAYEAAAGVFVDAGITSTQDIDLLMDARRSLRIVADDSVQEGALINLLRKVDRSFERTSQTFRAVNQDGYLVDLIKPPANPPWKGDRETIGTAEDELVATGIDGLAWLESAPAFEAIAIDEKGTPLRMEVPDPRVFAAHKLWVARQESREPIKRRRDIAQAEAVGELTARYLTHLPFDADELRMLPRPVFAAAEHLFKDQQIAFKSAF